MPRSEALMGTVSIIVIKMTGPVQHPCAAHGAVAERSGAHSLLFIVHFLRASSRSPRNESNAIMPSQSLSPPSAPHTPPPARGSLGELARDPESYIRLAERLAYWMDRRYVDPILGFVLPGAGDAIGASIGLLGVYAAFKLRAHPVVIARMLLNLAVDSLLGSIPLLGVVIDFVYRANTRNLALLRQRDVREARASDYVLVGGAALLFVLALALPVILVVALAVSLSR
jgi:hypothetical protein